MKVETKENIMGTMEEKLLIFKMALPMIFSVLVSSLYNIVDSIFIGRIGEKALTAISLGAPISSLMVEISIITYNLGAGKTDRVKNVINISIRFSLIIMIIGTLMFEIIPSTLLQVFSASGDMLSIGIIAFRIIGITYILQGISIILSGVFQAVGHSDMALYSSLVQAITLVGSAFAISKTNNINLVWFSFIISEVCMCLISIIFEKNITKEVLNT